MCDGKRTYEGEIETYYCVCFSTWHNVVLWLPRDPEMQREYRQLSLTVGYSPQRWRDRIESAWRCLRGTPAPLAEVILNLADTRALRDGLDHAIAVMEASETAETPVDALADAAAQEYRAGQTRRLVRKANPS